MVWHATLGGNCSPEEEQVAARALAKVASDLGVGVGFWTSNAPIDIDALMDAQPSTPQATAPQVPTAKAPDDTEVPVGRRSTTTRKSTKK